MPISNADLAGVTEASEAIAPAAEAAPAVSEPVAAPETPTAPQDAEGAAPDAGKDNGKRRSGWWQRKLFGE